VHQQSLWRSLHTWHLRRGEPQPAREALEASQQLTATTNWGIGAHVDRLGKVDETFREGKAAIALDALTPLMADKPATLVSVSALSLSSTILGQTGRASEALPDLDETIRRLAPEGDTPLLAQMWMIRSQAHNNGSAECIECLNRAIAICRQLGDGQQQGYLLTLRANQKQEALRLQLPREQVQLSGDMLADFEEARTLLLGYRNLEAMEMLGTLCQQWGLAHFVAGEYEACGRWLTEAEAVHRQSGLKPSLAFTLSHQGLVLMEIGRTAGPATYDKAIYRFRQASQLFEEAGLGAMMWRMCYYEGLAQFEAGQRETAGSGQRAERQEQAGRLLRQASEQIDRLRGFSGGGASQQGQYAGAAFMVDKQTVYATGLRLAYLCGQPEAMLYWLEQMKGRAMLDALGELQLPDSTLLEHPLVLRERELWQKKAQTPVVAQALAIQQQIDGLLDQMQHDPRTQSYAYARKGRPVTWPWIRDWLRAEEQNGQGRRLLLVSYYCTAGLTLAIGMRADWEEPRWERLALDYEPMTKTIRDYFRQPGGLRTALEDWGEGEWQRLQPLVYPVSLWSQPGDIVGLVPYGILHDTPLHTLKIQGQYLIERNPVFYLPALSLLPRLSLIAKPPLHVTNRVSVLGDSREDLPHARTEAGFVSDLFRVAARVGADVTRQTIFEALAGADLLHFAGHGELSAQSGLESGLLLAGGDTLRAKDLFGHHARTKLVVLSGCETGLSQHQEGDELFGFVRMLILAGVPRLLVSQWRVNDAATRALLEHLYQHLLHAPDAGIAVALQQAMLAVAKEQAHWKSFYYWGGFVAIGHWK
jgi:tetratricopeptide (TPR) repeat protein